MIQTSRTLLLALGASCFAMVTAQAETRATGSNLERWLDAYEKAWEDRDGAAAAALFTEDARYYETPYAEPFEGQGAIGEYWERVTADQRDIDFQWAVISEGPGIGVAHWTATFSLASNDATVDLDGVFVLQFDERGRCKVLREWWHARPEN